MSLPTHTVAIAREFQLEPADNMRLASLCGPLDANLRLLESRFDVQIRRRGHGFRVQGLRAETAERALRELHDQASGGAVSPEQVHLCIVELTSPGAAEGGGAIGGQRDPQVVRTPRLVIRARGAHQHAYLASIRESDLTFGIGPAGTGKTYLAMAKAVQALQAKQVNRIILTRPAVEAGERLGFLPGDLREKVDPYLRPIYDALYDLMDSRIVERALQAGEIEIAPLAFMRGRTLTNAAIILDEAQNTTSMQMKMFLTRLGENSRMIITGDPSQVDLPNGQTSGLAEAAKLLDGVEGIAQVKFTADDVIRHELVARIVAAYEGLPQRPATSKT